MRLVLLGAGRAGTSVSAVLRPLAEDCLVVSKSESSAKKAATILKAQEYVVSDVRAVSAGLLQENDLVVLGVPDDVLSSVASELVAIRDSWEGISICHLSGATSIDLLNPLSERGAETAVLHPCIPMSSRETTFFSDSLVTFEGPESLRARIAPGFEAAGAAFLSLPNVDRTFYHAGQVFCAGHLVALLSSAVSVLERSGLDSQSARQLMRSVSAGAMRELQDESSSLPSKITGPYARGDIEVIRREEAALDSFDPEIAAVFRVLGALSRKLSEQQG